MQLGCTLRRNATTTSPLQNNASPPLCPTAPTARPFGKPSLCRKPSALCTLLLHSSFFPFPCTSSFFLLSFAKPIGTRTLAVVEVVEAQYSVHQIFFSSAGYPMNARLSLPENHSMPCAEAFAECQISGTRQRGLLPRARSKALSKTKAHGL